MLDQGLSSVVEESLFVEVFSNKQNPQVAGCGVQGLHFPGVHCEEIAPLERDYFQGM